VFPEFASLKGVISYPTLKALTVKPFQLTHMTEVQAQVLTLLPKLAEPYDADSAEPGKKLPPRDILVKAKTGTGKTIAFLVPAIESRLNAARAHGQQAVRNAGLNNKSSLQAVATRRFMREHVGALIISPTRELATQIAEEALKVSQHHDNFGVRLFVGGANKRLQMRGWMKEQRDIVVATPGRLRDLLETEPEVARGIRLAKMVCGS
jgi:ATP-dependent RNA helicase MSS116